MDVDKEFAAARARAYQRADRWARDHAARQHVAGRADRATMGNPDPTLAEVFGTLGNNVREFVETIRKHFTP